MSLEDALTSQVSVEASKALRPIPTACRTGRREVSMRKSMVTIAVLAMSLPAVAQQTITCSSDDGRRHFCAANTRNGVMLVQEHSDNVCQQGSTWSYTRQGISVTGGCSADFKVGGSGNNANGSYGNNGYNSNGNNSNSRNNGYSQNSRNGNGYPNNDEEGNYSNNNDDQNGYGNNRNGNRLTIPSGTRLDVRLEQAVSPTEVNQGDVIPGSLVNDVSVNGRTVAPSGTPVQLKVASAHGSPLDLRLDSMTVNGQRYKLTSNSIHSVKDSQSAQSGNQSAGQQLGSVIGALTGGAQLPNGSVYTFRLTAPARPAMQNQ